MADTKCQLCGEPMPKGEEMFNYHGYSGPCPKPPLPRQSPENELIAERDREWCLALAEIDVAAHSASVRHGDIKVDRAYSSHSNAELVRSVTVLKDAALSTANYLESMAIYDHGRHCSSSACCASCVNGKANAQRLREASRLLEGKDTQ